MIALLRIIGWLVWTLFAAIVEDLLVLARLKYRGPSGPARWRR